MTRIKTCNLILLATISAIGLTACEPSDQAAEEAIKLPGQVLDAAKQAPEEIKQTAEQTIIRTKKVIEEFQRSDEQAINESKQDIVEDSQDRKKDDKGN